MGRDSIAARCPTSAREPAHSSRPGLSEHLTAQYTRHRPRRPGSAGTPKVLARAAPKRGGNGAIAAFPVAIKCFALRGMNAPVNIVYRSHAASASRRLSQSRRNAAPDPRAEANARNRCLLYGE